MFKLCPSTRIVTQNQHLLEFDLKTRNKRNSACQPTSYLSEPSKTPRYQSTHLQGDLKSFWNQSECVNRKNSRKGLELSSKGSQPKLNRKKMRIDINPQQSSFSLFETPLTTKALHNNMNNCFLSNQVATPKVHHHHLSTKIDTAHHPHSIISKRQKRQSQISDKSVQESQRRSNKAKPCLKPNIDSYWQIKKEDIVKNNNDFNTLRRTVKKQTCYNMTNSEQTVSKSNNRCQNLQLKKPYHFQNTKLTININKIQSLQQTNIQPQSPTKLMKLFQDAKSIESRQHQNSSQQECLFDQSVLIQRDIDMFQFITPIAGVKECQLMRAVDRREGNVVTLKFFNKEKEKQCHQELDMLKLVQGLANQEFPLKILKFKQTLIEDLPEKQIIFVYEPFQRLLCQQIQLLQARRQSTEAFIDNFICEVRILLLLLSINGFQLTRPLKLQDFVYLGHDWRIHNLSKFEVKVDQEGGSHLSGWLQQLRDDCCHLSSCNN